MNFEIITEKPLWFIIFCILLGVAYSIILYRNDSQFSEVNTIIKRLMTALRFLCVTILSFLLLTPLIKTITRSVEKPIIIIAQDASQSIVVGKDSVFYKKQFAESLTSLADELKDDFDIRTYSFGEKTSAQFDFNYKQKQTDFNGLFDQLNVQFDNRNLGAIILATDGIYNTGSSPLYLSEKFKVPFYTIALGDTTVRKDLILTKVNHNKIAFLGNSFPLEIVIDARQYAGSKTILTVEKDSTEIFSKQIDINNNKFHLTVPVYVDAKTKGIQHFKVKLSELSGELSTSNNATDVFVEVLESKMKVLLLANAPHPDISALKNAIESSMNYEVKTALISNFDNNIKEFNLIILHQLPSVNNTAQALIDAITKSDVPVLYILGAQTNINAFNAIKCGLTITNSNSNGKLNQVQADVNKNFSLFTLNEDFTKTINVMPPLTVPFGVYKLNAEGAVLLKQQIGNVVTDQPLLLFTDVNGRKNGIVCGEGFWRWGLKEFAEKNTRNGFNEFAQKIVQYLAVKENKSPFRIKYKNNIYENEQVQFDAELYNETGELINTPEIKINILNSAKKSFSYNFSKTEKAYTLNAGYFPVDNYSFNAEVKLGEKIYRQAGQFTVAPLQVELSSTIADHQLLNVLATRSGGKMIYPQQINELKKLLTDRKDITSVSYTQKQLKDLINLKWVFFLLITLLAAEWFLRKRSGGY